MSTSEALCFLGLDFYATATDIKAAYRRLAMHLRPDPATSDAATLRAAEEGMRRLNLAYAALSHRVDNTPPEELLQETTGRTKTKAPASSLRLPRLSMPHVALPKLALSRLELPTLSRFAVVTLVVVAVGYGIVHGVAEKQITPSVVDAKTEVAPQVAPVVEAKPVAQAVNSAPAPVQEPQPEAAAADAPRHTVRAPQLPGLDAEDAKAISDTCHAQATDAGDSSEAADSSEATEAFRACVLRTAQATPRPIHLD